MSKYEWHKTKQEGVRFRKHPTRKVEVGAVKHPDRYYTIRYQLGGKRIEEALGWWSGLVNENGERLSEAEIFTKLVELKTAAKNCTPDAPTRLREERERNAEVKTAAEKEKIRHLQEQKRIELENVTLERFFYDTYWPTVPTYRKPGSQLHDESHFKLWIAPVLGSKPIKSIVPLDLERVKKRMQDATKSPRMIQYVFATFRQIWNMARANHVVAGDSPTKDVKLPKFDNIRTRFFSQQEAADLLAYLEKHDITTMRMTALSLFSGMRADEIFNLTWKDIDIEAGTILIRESKNHEARYSFINAPINEILKGMTPGEPNDLLFSVTMGKRKGQPYKEIPDPFHKAVEALGFNRGVTNRNDKVVFHTCRHSFASWLVVDTPLLTVSKLTGHKTLVMAKRYAHLTDNTLRDTANKLQMFKPTEQAASSNVVPIRGAV